MDQGPDGRYGREKGRALGEKREERREKREAGVGGGDGLMQGSKRAIPRRRPSKRPPEVPKGFAGVAAAAAMNIRRQTLVEIMNNCTATVLQQGLHFPGFAYS